MTQELHQRARSWVNCWRKSARVASPWRLLSKELTRLEKKQPSMLAMRVRFPSPAPEVKSITQLNTTERNGHSSFFSPQKIDFLKPAETRHSLNRCVWVCGGFVANRTASWERVCASKGHIRSTTRRHALGALYLCKLTFELRLALFPIRHDPVQELVKIGPVVVVNHVAKLVGDDVVNGVDR
jgi:hypothetical protein